MPRLPPLNLATKKKVERGSSLRRSPSPRIIGRQRRFACRRHQRCWEGNGDLGTSPFCAQRLRQAVREIGKCLKPEAAVA